MNTVTLAAFAVAATAGTTLAQINVINTNNVNTLVSALTGGASQLNVLNASLSGQQFGGAVSTGVFSAGGNNYALGTAGIVLSTGNASDYKSGPNTSSSFSTGYGAFATAAQQAVLEPIGGPFTYYDVTELSIEIEGGDFNEIAFFLTFGSEEYPEYVGTSFIDGFGILVNGVNQAFIDGLPININHPWFAPVAETELDGVIADPTTGQARIRVVVPVVPNQNNTLTFIIADASDDIFDTTVYIEALVPTPGALALFGIAGLAAARRRRA